MTTSAPPPHGHLSLVLVRESQVMHGFMHSMHPKPPPLNLFCYYDFMTIVNEDFDIIFIIFSTLSALNLNEEGISVARDPVLIKCTHNNVLM